MVILGKYRGWGQEAYLRNSSRARSWSPSINVGTNHLLFGFGDDLNPHRNPAPLQIPRYTNASISVKRLVFWKKESKVGARAIGLHRGTAVTCTPPACDDTWGFANHCVPRSSEPLQNPPKFSKGLRRWEGGGIRVCGEGARSQSLLFWGFYGFLCFCLPVFG